jgi:hypothetical protein
MGGRYFIIEQKIRRKNLSDIYHQDIKDLKTFMDTEQIVLAFSRNLVLVVVHVTVIILQSASLCARAG